MHLSSLDTVVQPVKFRVPRAARLVLPIFLLFAYVVQCVWFARTQSFTYDEPQHITTGLHNWRFDRFDLVLEHPPLGHLLPTLPIAFGNWEITWADPQTKGIMVTGITDPIELATRVRLVNVALGVFLGVVLWFVTRNIFSEGAANLILTLFAFSPSLIANFTLVTTDGVTTLMIFLAAVQLVRWRTDRSLHATLLLGVILGFLLLSKLSTPPVFCLALALILVLKPGFMRRPLQHHLTLPVPAGEYFEGIADLVVHNQNGHQTFLFGKSGFTQKLWF